MGLCCCRSFRDIEMYHVSLRVQGIANNCGIIDSTKDEPAPWCTCHFYDLFVITHDDTTFPVIPADLESL